MQVTQSFLDKLRRNLASAIREDEAIVHAWDDGQILAILHAFNRAALATILGGEEAEPLTKPRGPQKGSAAARERALKAQETRRRNANAAGSTPGDPVPINGGSQLG
jgi:hypothetical protein